MKRKLSAILLALAASVCLALGLAACTNSGGTHTHTWTDWTVTLPPTCTQAGEQERHCTGCSETETQPIPAAGHSWGEWTVTTQPDCETEGERTRACSACLQTESESIDAVGHSWGTWANEGDIHTRTCENCGTADRQAHTFQNGLCSVCGEPEVELRLASTGGYYLVVGLGHSDGSDVVIPSEYNGISVSVINTRALNEEDSLQSIYIPASVQTIGQSAFWGSSNLKTVTFESGSLLSRIYADAFKNCTSLQSISLGNRLREIGDCAFEDCTSLTSVNLGSTVTTIGFRAFANTAITEITIPESVQAIDSSFVLCSELSAINYNAINAQSEGNTFDSAGENTDGVTVVIGDKVEVIPDKLFSWTNLAEIQFGSSLHTIGEYAFNRCGENITEFTIPAGVTTIGAYAFYKCSVLESVTIEGSPTIGNSAFYECAALKEIDLGGATEIGANAFRGCTALTDVTIPGSVTVIGESAFDSCEDLMSVTTDGTQTIGKNAFSNCRKLSEVTLGEGLLTIEGYAFNNCSSLKTLTIPASVTEIKLAAFMGVSFDSVIFKQPSGWTEVATEKAVERSVLSDPASAAEYISGYNDHIAREV